MEGVRAKMGNSVAVKSLLLLWMLTSFKASSALPRIRESFSAIGDDLPRTLESLATMELPRYGREPILLARNTREKRNLLEAPPSGFTWIDGALYRDHDIFYLSDADRDVLKVPEPGNSASFGTKFKASLQRDLAVQGGSLASSAWSNAEVSSDVVENDHKIMRKLQFNRRNEQSTASLDLPEKKQPDLTERPISVNSVVSHFLTGLVPPNPDSHVTRLAFDITEHSNQEHIPVEVPEFKLNEKREENISISSLGEGEDVTEVEVRKYIHGSAHSKSESFIPEGIPQSVLSRNEKIHSFTQIQTLPQKLYASSSVSTEGQRVSPDVEPVLLPVDEFKEFIPLKNVNLGVQDVVVPTMSHSIQLKSSAVKSLSNGELSSLTNLLSPVEYIPFEKQYSVPSVDSLFPIEPSYTHIQDSGIETLQPTPPLPSRGKAFPTRLAQLSDDKIDSTIAYGPESLSKAGTARSVFGASVSPIFSEELVPKSAVVHLLDLEVNRFEEKERSHPALLTLSPVAPPEYNRVSLLNRLKELSNSRKHISRLAAKNITITSPARNDNILGYVGGNFGGPHEAAARLPSACDCAPAASCRTLVVVDDEVIGTFGLNGFRRRNFDFGSAWKNFPTTTIAWPASALERLSSAAAVPCGRVTSVSTVTYYHTPVRPQDVIVTHTRTLFTVVTRTVTRFGRA